MKKVVRVMRRFVADEQGLEMRGRVEVTADLSHVYPGGDGILLV